ncbi:uncharacterized protein L203_101353 [Cryptococcus depauperatus CBS 7841]|uniref:Uncharacterized protein n=1 Tax=Cryptococcus depauperatus CBS 7841 TaxID=1295531 RepID=A0A1E3IC58_9TREE|nr:hypothetical protein L203_04287 [Cryptococcus depauperatus CBS 7841]
MPPKSPIVASSRPFRILALPLTRLPLPPPSSTTPPTHPPPSLESTTPKLPLTLFHSIQPNYREDSSTSIVNKILVKSSDAWLKLGEKPKGSWMYWFYDRGERLMDRIEFEEWALKAVREGEGVKVTKEGGVLERIEIPLLLPKLKGQPLPSIVPKLHRHLLRRIPHHKKMMYRSLLVSPITWPFAIIPIVPNFPLFYVLWRAWSHYKAWRGAIYLEQLLKAGLIVEKESPELTEIYAGKGKAAHKTNQDGGLDAQTEKGGAVHETATPESMASRSEENTSKQKQYGTVNQPMPPPAPGPITSKATHPSLLLSPSQIPILVKAFNLKPNEVVDITRAVEQADFRARKAEEGTK